MISTAIVTCHGQRRVLSNAAAGEGSTHSQPPCTHGTARRYTASPQHCPAVTSCNTRAVCMLAQSTADTADTAALSATTRSSATRAQSSTAPSQSRTRPNRHHTQRPNRQRSCLALTGRGTGTRLPRHALPQPWRYGSCKLRRRRWI